MTDLVTSTLALFLSLSTTILVEQMGDNRFAVREGASRSLSAVLQHDWGVVLLRAAEDATRHRDPEVARRAGTLVEEFLDIRPTAQTTVPWIDMLPEKIDDRQRILDEYLARARTEVGSHGPPEWHDYRLATVYFAQDRLRAGVPRSQLVFLLDEMADNEKRYLSRR